MPQNRFESRISDVTVMNNSAKVANLVNSWDIKFDGSARLSVENFIYRIESQVFDTLNGNFELLCEHAQCLFLKEAKDWYWWFRRTVNRVTWPILCEALRTSFGQHRSDIDIKEDMRTRKQNPSETFDDYKNAIFKISENLSTPLREQELVDILQRGLRPRIRQQLLYINITSVAELRCLCLKGESLLKEISKSDSMVNRNQVQRRFINEIDRETIDETLNDNILTEGDINGLSRDRETKLKCWNCHREGHRYFDCLEDRTVFCYGCGEVGVYKPKCVKCSSGNSKVSECAKQNLRKDPLTEN
ncbi:hypothetical protein CVS40_7153 [Lucilia cuprina]|nr:hypothetical protein CVS40_7153 [Lucilia cuprina]